MFASKRRFLRNLADDHGFPLASDTTSGPKLGVARERTAILSSPWARASDQTRPIAGPIRSSAAVLDRHRRLTTADLDATSCLWRTALPHRARRWAPTRR